MKLNWFSPLPPARTEIAQYTVRLLPALRERCEVILWTDQDTWDPALEQHARVRTYQIGDVPWAAMNEADVSVYHIGNNHTCHAGIWEVSRRHPGIVILHDLTLHFLFGGYYRDNGARATYLQHLERFYGRRGVVAGERYLSGLHFSTQHMAEEFPLTELGIENALGVLLHSPHAFAALRQMDRWPIIYAPLPQAATPPHLDPAAHEARWRCGPPYRLVAFGYMGPPKRLDSIWTAIAHFPHKKQLRLDIYGPIWDESYVGRRIAELGIAELVTVHGFVADTELNAALDAAHLALNLRHPTMGEASASQLRIWDHALPSLVTPGGWYATLPETAVGHVRPEHEVADLHRHFHELLDDPAAFARRGAEGRRLLEQWHRPESYVDAICGFAERIIPFRPRLLVDGVTQRVVEELALWTHGTAEATYRRVAEEICRIAS
jgi:glycosyltransferase involved in cell wall biosynthesis